MKKGEEQKNTAVKNAARGGLGTRLYSSRPQPTHCNMTQWNLLGVCGGSKDLRQKMNDNYNYIILASDATTEDIKLLIFYTDMRYGLGF